ncbi:hypothetical protein T071_01320 [Salmonella enterica subsp. enterica]|nr:hypothetical protein [Salmonella enterica subsp. enterica serovar Tennessee]EHM2199133.1 hypothetical protein [Salmonella enterica]QFH73087.1 hypothetical protein FR762_25360 [Enterobacter sp. E76]EBK1870483.1 hypothetical protein [Salmonella enterica subsp. enterica serovar Tennessee]ECM2009310.1 hypothetical protein [Salmonella enterica subsp. enterica serovar Tennessee]
MAVIKTHTGTVITRTGEKTVKLHQNPTTWVVGPKEYYYKDTGRRGGAAGVRTRLLLSSIQPLVNAEG